MVRRNSVFVFNDENDPQTICYVARTNLSSKIKNIVSMAFSSIIKDLKEKYKIEIPTEITNFHLLESFIFSNFAKPKYATGDYIKVEAFGLETIPNKEINTVIVDCVVDYSKCEIVYMIQYSLDSEYRLKTVKEKNILGLQSAEALTKENFTGRDDFERSQHLKMLERANKIED